MNFAVKNWKNTLELPSQFWILRYKLSFLIWLKLKQNNNVS